ncbi:hypothetical protein COHA_001807 [Chlorella ohadii]|uniref:MYND-type domain-containing protein n=1 Tax=Chlorella ohadii TaxID=2649997 RepID=A0AAD5DYK7_9CHLO|nr:hypothetical protein COHA_001807 [Chlorella ohadii]
MLCTCPALAAHKQQLLDNEELCIQLFDVLQPAMPALAVSLQLPRERRPADCSWRSAAALAAFIACMPVSPRATQLLLAQDADGSRSSRMLQAAAQLLQHAPWVVGSAEPQQAASATVAAVMRWAAQAEADEEEESEELLTDGSLFSVAHFIGQLGWAVERQRDSMAEQSAAGFSAHARHRRTAHQLLAAVPSIGCLLRRTADAPLSDAPLDVRVEVYGAAAAVLMLLTEVLCPGESRSDLQASGSAAATRQPQAPAALSTLADLASWYTGTAAMLGWLPALADLEPVQHSAASGEAREGIVAACELLVTRMGEAARLTTKRSQQLAGSSGTVVLPQAEACSLLTAVSQLAAVGCRAVHFAVAGGSERRPCLADHVLHELLRDMLCWLCVLARAAADGSPAGLEQRLRVLRTACLAHWEAVQALLEQGYELAGMSAYALVEELAVLIMGGPPALAISPAIQALLSEAVPRLQQANKAQVAAVMLASGLMDAVVRDLIDLASPEGGRGEGAQQAGQIMSQEIQPLLDSLLMAAAAAGLDPAKELAVAYRTAFKPAAVLTSRSLAHVFRRTVQSQVLPPARRAATALLAWWRRPEAQPAAALELAQAVAARSCAYLRCANLGGEGGLAAGQGAGSQRCSACRAVWYCGTACSHADWRAGHRRVCKALGAARAAEKERRRQAAAADAAAGEGQA